MSDDQNTFTTSRGKVVTFLPIATLLDKIRASHPMPKPPTYKVETKLGGVEIHEHNETTLETDEEKTAWANFQMQLAEAQAELNRALTRAILMRGLVFEYPSNYDWIKEQEFLGIKVPEDANERRLHYAETEVMGSVDDYEGVTLGVMGASGVSEDLLKQMDASFRRSLGRVERDAVEPVADSTGQVVPQSEVRAGEGSHKKRATRQSV